MQKEFSQSGRKVAGKLLLYRASCLLLMVHGATGFVVCDAALPVLTRGNWARL